MLHLPGVTVRLSGCATSPRPSAFRRSCRAFPAKRCQGRGSPHSLPLAVLGCWEVEKGWDKIRPLEQGRDRILQAIGAGKEPNPNPTASWNSQKGKAHIARARGEKLGVLCGLPPLEQCLGPVVPAVLAVSPPVLNVYLRATGGVGRW